MFKYEIDGHVFHEGDRVLSNHCGNKGIVVRPDEVPEGSFFSLDPHLWVYCKLDNGKYTGARADYLELIYRRRIPRKELDMNYLSIVLAGEE
jgi:hypothetical protein